MRTLSNIDIEDLCKRYNIKFDGLYNRDNIPNNLSKGYYVLNMDKESGDGTHWVSWFENNDDKINIYFDSFGFVPPELLDGLLKTYIYNSKEIQDIDSSSCGWFCVAFMFCLQNYPDNEVKNFERFVNMFGDNTEVNEKTLELFFESL